MAAEDSRVNPAVRKVKIPGFNMRVSKRHLIRVRVQEMR
jgi:hypothetical protein